MSSIDLHKPVICVVGPTASGKTGFAQALAERLDAEILSADSMQIYRGMDIGTGKILPQDRSVPYFGLDIVEPNQAYSAALFQDYARSVFKNVNARGKQTIVCGGTGLYVRAAIDDYDFPKGEQVENPLRDKYQALEADIGAQELWRVLNTYDTASAACIHPNNSRRTIRALELYHQGKSYAQLKSQLAEIPQAVPAHFLGLAVDAEVLRQRISRRVDQMFADGLVEEVQTLLNSGFRQALTATAAIGYKEVVAALDGICSMEDACAEIKLASYQYARRQRTWFNKDKRIHWLCADSLDLDQLLTQVPAELLQ